MPCMLFGKTYKKLYLVIKNFGNLIAKLFFFFQAQSTSSMFL